MVSTELSPLEILRRRLLRRAHLFDDPRAYAAGVNDAFEAVAESPEEERDVGADAAGPDRRSPPPSSVPMVGRSTP